ncbi:MAG: hypothetical protein ACOC31_00405 [Bacteroidota bacterium]
MSKNSTIYFVYQNFPDVQSEVMDIDKLFVNHKDFAKVYGYLDNLRTTAPDKLVENILKRAHD